MSVNLIIVAVTCIVSYFAMDNRQLKGQLLHSPYTESRERQFYRWISSGFVHGSWLHLGINMFVLWQFGDIVEGKFKEVFGLTFGSTIYLIFYLSAIIFGDLPTYIKHKNNPSYASLGASGAVSGVIFIYMLFYPWQPIYLYAIIPIYSILAGIAYLWYSSWASKNSRDNIDHSAHFYGAVYGVLFMIIAAPGLIPYFIERLLDFPF